VATTVLRTRRGHGYAAAVVGLSFLLLATLGSPESTPSASGLAQTAHKAQSSLAAQAAPAAAPTRGRTPAVLDVFPVNLAGKVPPDAPVTVTAKTGTLRTVSLLDAKGNEIAGEAGSASAWRSTDLLRPSTAYTLRIWAIGPDGMVTTTRSRFTTLKPGVEATYHLTPADGVVGVGMPAIVQFDTPVTTAARRAEVEKRVKVTSVPAQLGAWGWLDDRQLMYRPRTYWKPGTKVTVSTTLHGVQTGPGKWVAQDNGARFTIGPSMVSTVNMKTHTLTLRRNGKTIRTFPVSTGRPGPKTETRSGIKLVMERASLVVMDSTSLGIPKGSPGYYRIPTNWNLRVTWTGEYIHSAPWSVGAQGNSNVSHGCTNMSPTAAKYMYDVSKVGDVVYFTGSSRTFEPTEGIGVWVYSYASWKARSALAGS
jgi:lipoprotein-anchoring transpeptidase ErfK/SrfK